MKADFEKKLPRRDFLRLAIAGAAVAGPQLAEPAQAAPIDTKDKRRARYQANSAEVRNFYRVNAYPAHSEKR
jgi:hypothetical protein